MSGDLVKRLRNGLCMLAQEEAADRIEELEAKLAKAVGDLTHEVKRSRRHLAKSTLDTLAELTGGNDEWHV